MTIPKSFGDWKVTHGKDDRDHVVVTMEHPEFSYVQVIGEKGIDPSIVYDNATVVALEEEYRRMEMSGKENAVLVTKLMETRREVVERKQNRSRITADQAVNQRGSE